MKAPITSPSISADDVSDETLFVEVKVEELVGFSEEQLVPIGKIELEVMFGSEGLCRRTVMKFTVVRASSPYNIILGRTGMKELWEISSTTHAMMKFLTPRGIATLVARTVAVFKCRCLEEKQVMPEEKSDKKVLEDKKKLLEEDILVNPAFPEQKITIST
ncbi:hypothetical protein Tco_0773282 [Tanacetum coccineum]|uniref:Reverse transcriptase domain-containing protein n=1 Tax=Tanacetum coccineum TaxID=301880 RepID=A0ABQ4ZMX1_9ASTR